MLALSFRPLIHLELVLHGVEERSLLPPSFLVVFAVEAAPFPVHVCGTFVANMLAVWCVCLFYTYVSIDGGLFLG